MVILLSDGYLELKQSHPNNQERRALRFFRLVRRLPLDIMMELTKKVYLSPKGYFLSQEIERGLARVLSSFA